MPKHKNTHLNFCIKSIKFASHIQYIIEFLLSQYASFGQLGEGRAVCNALMNHKFAGATLAVPEEKVLHQGTTPFLSTATPLKRLLHLPQAAEPFKTTNFVAQLARALDF